MARIILGWKNGFHVESRGVPLLFDSCLILVSIDQFAQFFNVSNLDFSNPAAFERCFIDQFRAVTQFFVDLNDFACYRA